MVEPGPHNCPGGDGEDESVCMSCEERYQRFCEQTGVIGMERLEGTEGCGFESTGEGEKGEVNCLACLGGRWRR